MARAQTDSGVVQTQQQMPVFTQGLPDYDVLVTADENEVFAGYLPYRTWDARPVVGSAGLRPVSWSSSSESWGGAQLQDRFIRLAHRLMTPLDMQAWTACRMIGEAASRSGSTDPANIMQNMKSPDFGIAAYEGQRTVTLETGTCSFASRFCWTTDDRWYPSRRNPASCIRSPSSIRSVSIVRKRNANCDARPDFRLWS